jgi:mannose-6-phosphate isomerase-like protein (cupin superfamily)/uncharacterized protein YndB with AHSA1/START domain
VARAGDVLENPVTGERIVFRRTAADTDGAALEYEIRFRPQGFVAQEHLHPRQSERHEVVEGRLGLAVGGREQVLEPGDSVVVPPRTPHRLFPVGDGLVTAIFESRPALETEVLLETFVRLAQEGKVNAKGYPDPLHGALLAREFVPEGYATRPPLAVQAVLFAGLAAVARGVGYTARADEERLPREYVFVDEWDVDAPREAVFDALADGRTYPEWWRPVYISVDAPGPPAVGVVSTQHFKGRLPYTLRTRSEITRLDRPYQVEADVVGDLTGRGLWTLTERDGRVHVRFDWRVNADKPLLYALTPVLRPAFRWNHNWAIARAKEGLEPYARRRAANA